MAKYFLVIFSMLVLIISACSSGGETRGDEDTTGNDIIVLTDAVEDIRVDGITGDVASDVLADTFVDTGFDIIAEDISDISADILNDAAGKDTISNDVPGEDVVIKDTNLEDISDVSRDVSEDAEIPDAGDTTPPETTITSYPQNPSNSDTATFEFICDEKNCSFECQLDNSGWTPCESPKTYTGLLEGTHTFEVRAKDSAGNIDPTPARYTWTIKISRIMVLSISAGGGHTCAVLSDKTIKCWGWNYSGQLGDGTYENSLTPVKVKDIDNAVVVSAGAHHTCSVLSDGVVKCWGYNYSGQLGDGTNDDSNTPVIVKGLQKAIVVSAGSRHSCAVLSDGYVKCWGENSNGKLGDGTYKNSNIPVTVSGISSAVSVSAGGEHSCAVLSNGEVMCWGDNGSGQLGDGTNNDSPIPVKVRDINNAIGVSAGGHHTCVVLSDKTIRCFGDNYFGQLGNKSNDSSSLPVVVNDITDASDSIAAGEDHTCAVLINGIVKCWGRNRYGQLGNGTDDNNYNYPVSVKDIDNAISVSAGGEYSCAILSDHIAKCWGSNFYGQLGDGTTDDSSVPVTVEFVK